MGTNKEGDSSSDENSGFVPTTPTQPNPTQPNPTQLQVIDYQRSVLEDLGIQMVTDQHAHKNMTYTHVRTHGHA